MKLSQQLQHWLMEAFCVGVLLGAIALVPLSSIGFVLPKLLLFSIAAFCGILAVALSENPGGPLSALVRTGAGRLLLAFFLVVCLSLFWSVAPLLSFVGMPPRFEGVLAYAAFFALALAAYVFVQQERGRKALINTIVLGNAIVVLYGFVQLLHLDPLGAFWKEELFLGRVFSLLGQPDFLGVFLLLTFPFISLAFARAARNRRALLVFLLFAANILVLVGTVSRAALLGACGMALLTVAAEWPRRAISGEPFETLTGPQARNGRSAMSRLTAHSSQLTAQMIFGGVFLLGLAVVGIISFTQRFSAPTQSPFALGGRSVIWSESLAMIRARPLGYGLDAPGLVFPRFTEPALREYEPLTSEIDRAHSKPLDLLLTLGPLGLLSYYAFLLLLLVSLWRKRRDDALALPSFLALAGASIALLAGFDTAATHAFFWLIAGMALGSLEKTGSSRPFAAARPDAVGRVGLVGRARLFLCVFVFALFVTSVGFVVWMDSRIELERSNQYVAKGETASAIRAAARGAELFPADRSLLTRTVELSLLGQEQAGNAKSKKLLQLVVDLELERLERLTSGEDGLILPFRAWQASVSGDADEAQRLLTRAMIERPRSITTYRIAAHCYSLLQDEERAAAANRTLISLLPPSWRDPASPRGRILWKENPWLSDLVSSE